MIIRLLIFSFFCVCSIQCQSILASMLANPSISQFSTIINNTQALKDYCNNPSLVIFVPSNIAMSAISLSNVDLVKLIKSHMYLSTVTAEQYQIVGTTSNWTFYAKVTAKSNQIFYRMVSLDILNVLFMYSSGGQFYVNNALISTPNNMAGTQVYHIINTVLVNYQYISFLKYICSSTSLSISCNFWKILSLAADKSLLPFGSFQSNFLSFTPTFPGTVLVPTNAAWNTLNSVDMTALTNNINNMNYTSFIAIMARFYIPDTLIFWTGSNVKFLAGFNAAPQVNDNGLFPGILTNDLQVNVQNFTGKVVQPNIPLLFGVIHLIDNPFVNAMSPSTYLSQFNSLYMGQINKFPILLTYLNGNYTIMAIDDTTIARLSGIPTVNITQELLNSIIPGSVNFTITMVNVNTLGGLTIKLAVLNQTNYITVLQSSSDNTWVHITPVLALNQMVGPTYVTRLNGSLSPYPSSCDETFQILNSRIYQSLLAPNNNNITLNIGSPYTMFVPDDATMLTYLVNFTSWNSPIIKYVLQRMIIPNRVILQTQPSGLVSAATMNYAAMSEMVNLTITSTNCTISFNGYQQTFNFSGGGYYCYSNSMNDSTRYNLIYPVQFVLSNPADASAKICVTAPCVACHIKFDYLLLIVISLLMIVHIKNANI